MSWESKADLEVGFDRVRDRIVRIERRLEIASPE